MQKLSMRYAILALTLLVALTPRAHAQSADTPPAFPFPRAEKEFTALMPDLREYCEHITQADTKAFIVALSVYGPLDLQVRKAESPTEARSLRGFHLGVAAAMSQMPEDLAQRLGQPFQNAPADVQGRKQRLVQELPQIEAFVTRFQAVPQITLLAHWGFTGEFRVNDTFHMRDQTNEAVPSPVLGFVPSGQWKHDATVQDYLDTIHVTKATFNGLNEAFQPLFVVAVRRTESGDTEVIGTGIASDRAGLLFVHDAAKHPTVGQRQPDGAKYSVVDQIKPGVFYFETA